MAAEGLQKRLQTEIDKYKALQKDFQKHMTARQQLDSQLNENTLVIEEFKRLDGEAKVYKMIGPVLVKQDLEESKQNVQKRIDYINGEIWAIKCMMNLPRHGQPIRIYACDSDEGYSKRHENAVKDLEKKQTTQRETLTKLQQQYQQQQVKAAVKA